MRFDPETPSTDDGHHIPAARLIELYRHMSMAREIDRVEVHHLQRGDAAFAVSGAGHEAMAALADHLGAEDYLHLHYRDKALMLARGMAPDTFFLALFCKDASPSRGRQMSAHLSCRRLRILSLTGPVGNHALQAAGVAAEVRQRGLGGIVVCSMGDGTTQQGEVLEAIAEAVRRQLPVLFVIEANGLAISTRTSGQTFFDLPGGPAESFYGMPIHRLDGGDAVACHARFGAILSAMRANGGPAIALMCVERLANHTNADDERIYRDAAELDRVRKSDPVAALRQCLVERKIDVDGIDGETRTQVAAAARSALDSAGPQPMFTATRPLSMPPAEYRGSDAEPRLTMLAAVRGVLHERLGSDPRVSLYGQDIEDPKGDVFGLTRGLSTEFPGRVVNAPLSESTIVGTAIGRSLAGGRPVAFLQFADFLPNAFNQIASELGSLHWRTAGEWECPVIVMIASGAYRPGLGPFHAQSLESLAAHVPGVDVMIPSTAADAAGLLNAAFDGGRPTLFFYPKNCLNRGGPEWTTSADLAAHRVAPGRARRLREGGDITLVAWGNTVALCAEVADALAQAGYAADLLDLRTLAPWDEQAVLASAQRTGRLLVVHEDSRTCGFGAEVLATALEKSGKPLLARRVVRADTYVPCNFDNQQEVLPSFRRVLTEAGRLLGWEVDWRQGAAAEPGVFLLEAVGTAPSDRRILLQNWQVRPGDTIEEGQTIVELEGSKSVFELASPVYGVVEALLVQGGQEADVGAPIARIRLPSGHPGASAKPRWLPVMPERRVPVPGTAAPAASPERQGVTVGITAVAAVTGGRAVSNEDLLREHWGQSGADIARKTGIVSRRRIGPGEDVVSLGAAAARKVLAEGGLQISDVGLVLCSTGTPDLLSPSVACRVLERLTSGHTCAAYDFNAACSGYLYGLSAAYDHLRTRPGDHVLLITSEVISPLLDPDDMTTAILFADAATATIVSGASHLDKLRLLIEPPHLGASPEPGKYLRAPHADSADALAMDGMKVFEMGVRCMSSSLRKACAEAGLTPGELDLVVPHQANQRILETVCGLLRLPVERLYSNLSLVGNTSSSSIPICLAELLTEESKPRVLGLAAFGAGFTYGACIVRSRSPAPSTPS